VLEWHDGAVVKASEKLRVRFSAVALLCNNLAQVVHNRVPSALKTRPYGAKEICVILFQFYSASSGTKRCHNLLVIYFTVTRGCVRCLCIAHS